MKKFLIGSASIIALALGVVFATVIFASDAEMKDEKKADSHPAATARVGEAAPDFTLTDQNGKEVTLSSFKGKLVVMEWINPHCPFVVRHYNENTMIELQKKFGGENLVWLRVNSTNTDHKDFMTAEQTIEWAKEHEVSGPILNDSEGKVGHMYGAKTTPHMYVVAPSGTLVYSGAIDNDPRGSMENGERQNYVSAILASWKSGSELAPSANDSYGCGVKYKK